MEQQPYLLHALSPLHAGTGQGVDVIDLPIARLKATGIPFVPGSSIKGVLREARRATNLPADTLQTVFGPEPKRADEHAGALIVGDARLLALPVRAFRGTFAWVTSPLLLRLAQRDLDVPGGPPGVPPTVPAAGSGPWARVASDSGPDHSLNLHPTPPAPGPATASRATAAQPGASARPAAPPATVAVKVYLEDLDLPAAASADVSAWADFLAPWVVPNAESIFTRRFVVVDDETMTFLCETATQVDARVRIDDKTQTVATGQLWLEESLPSESLLVGLLAADIGRHPKAQLPAADVMKQALPDAEILQFGGKATVGRGRSRLIPLGAAANPKGGRP